MRGGWKASGFDGRDWTFSDLPAGGDRPPRPPFPALDQNDANCCVAAALTAAMECLDAARGHAVELSPLFNYYTTRTRRTYTGSVDIRASAQAACTHGVCAAELHTGAAGSRGPFTRADALRQPTFAAFTDAQNRRLVEVDPNWQTLGYYSLDGPSRAGAWIEALRRGLPIVIGLFTTEAYRALGSATQVVREVSRNAGSSGHAALVYDFDGETFKVRDSRGPGFCDSGDWYLSAQVVETSWVAESWAIASLDYDT